MRVYATGAAALAAPAAGLRRGSAGGFAVAEGEAAPAARSASGPRAVASLDALMALQAFEDPAERRRKAVKRGRTLLDAMDALKIGVLGGGLDASALARLRTLADAMGENSGDARLDAVLAEIDLRAAVELAKFSRR